MKIFKKIELISIIFFLGASFLVSQPTKAEDFKWVLCQNVYDKTWSCKNTGGVMGSGQDCWTSKYDTQADCEVEVEKKKPTPSSATPPAIAPAGTAGDFMCQCPNSCSNFSASSIEQAQTQCKDSGGVNCKLQSGECPKSNLKPAATGSPVDEVRCLCEEPGGKSVCIYDVAPKVFTVQLEDDCAAKIDKNHLNCKIEEGNCGDYNKSTKYSLDSLKVEAKQKLNPVGFGTGTAGFLKLVGLAIAFLMFPIGGFAMLMFIYAGFLWMSGSPDNITKAKSILTWTTLGIIMSLSSYLLVKFVFDNLF